MGQITRTTLYRLHTVVNEMLQFDDDVVCLLPNAIIDPYKVIVHTTDPDHVLEIMNKYRNREWIRSIEWDKSASVVVIRIIEGP